MPWSIVYEPVVDEPYVVPPSPTKCLAVASTLSLLRRGRCRPGLPCRPVITVSIDCDERRVLAEALVGTAPAVVADDAHAGREVPRDAGGADLGRGHRTGPLGQVRVAGRRRCRCCAAGSSRRPRCCGRGPRPRRRSAGSAAGSPARCSWKASIIAAQAAGGVRRRHRAAAGEQRAEVVRRDVGPGPRARCARPGSSGRPSRPGSSGRAGRRRASSPGAWGSGTGGRGR